MARVQRKVLLVFVRFFKFIYILKERDREQSGEGQREDWERIPSRILAVGTEPDVRLGLTNREIMT